MTTATLFFVLFVFAVCRLGLRWPFWGSDRPLPEGSRLSVRHKCYCFLTNKSEKRQSFLRLYQAWKTRCPFRRRGFQTWQWNLHTWMVVLIHYPLADRRHCCHRWERERFCSVCPSLRRDQVPSGGACRNEESSRQAAHRSVVFPLPWRSHHGGWTSMLQPADRGVGHSFPF